mmetsp:Transcript_37904/g.48885  ORF Transcript_37904/g.48885 Transcript_37904/m.48885 type:complete len:213 (-) Transcript_37904:353-991(-)
MRSIPGRNRKTNQLKILQLRCLGYFWRYGTCVKFSCWIIVKLSPLVCCTGSKSITLNLGQKKLWKEEKPCSRILSRRAVQTFGPLSVRWQLLGLFWRLSKYYSCTRGMWKGCGGIRTSWKLRTCYSRSCPPQKIWSPHRNDWLSSRGGGSDGTSRLKRCMPMKRWPKWTHRLLNYLECWLEMMRYWQNILPTGHSFWLHKFSSTPLLSSGST